MHIITKQEAIAQGLTRYFTGKPCKNGHLDERPVSNGECCRCRAEQSSRYRAENKEKVREYRARYDAENRGKAQERKARYRSENSERLQEYNARYRAENQEKLREYKSIYRSRNPEKERERGAIYRSKDPEKLLDKYARYYAENLDKVRETKARYRAANPEKMREKSARYRSNNPEKVHARRVNRRASLLQRTPVWFGEFDYMVMIEAIDLAKRREQSTGIKWHVDHMIPLQGCQASGLHCAQNLQVIPAALNLKKSNRHWLTNPGDWLK